MSFEKFTKSISTRRNELIANFITVLDASPKFLQTKVRAFLRNINFIFPELTYNRFFQ